ncbi:MAG: leucine--tRNA ligase, partial [Candidatus Moranbacteria bacterium]|nr:leucine--tRNA ligase [Candidatus Moranbacteria bacterium]
QVQFPIFNSQFSIEVFTTRLDTIYGCTYVVIAPEHPLVQNVESRMLNVDEVRKYIATTKKKTDLERTELNKDKTGVCLEGVEVIHPFTGERLPVYIADYVLGTYGTGAVMGVPAHDERDFVFAKKYQLEIIEVIEGKEPQIEEKPFTDDGTLVASKEFTGLTSEEAREKMVAWLKKEKLGKKVVNYRLRDWLISRQRYWGAPIPIIYCDTCGTVPVPEKDLPVKLPTDVDFRPTGESPLVSSKSFHKVNCPTCGAKARRESDTMDTFVCSSWYYLRFADPQNTKVFASKKALAKYLPVDFYMGGAEHTVLHLLYARFFTKALMKHGYLDFAEPFQKLRHQGMILAPDGNKMSKSKGNVINPDQMVAEFGADSLRLYEMFMGPLEDMKAWNTGSIIGVRRFLDKVWRLRQKTDNNQQKMENRELESLLHRTIKKVTEDLEELKFNTAISSLMILVNELEKADRISLITYQTSLILLSPLAPHITEELWSQIGEKKSIFLAPWPKYDAKKIVAETVSVAVQVNGKVRAVIAVVSGTSEEAVKAQALADANVKLHLADKTVHKVIYVPGKIVSIVVS